MIPDYIREQVLNAKPPDGCCVPGGSVLAVAEGHFTFARAATVGINPHGSWNRKDYLPKECLTLDRDDLDEQFLNRVWGGENAILRAQYSSVLHHVEADPQRVRSHLRRQIWR